MMALSLETPLSSTVLLSVIFLQGVSGTFFPPVSNPPPIPGQAVRTLDTPPQKLLVQEDIPQDLPQTFVKEGLFSPEDANLEQRWYIQENQSGDTSAIQTSVETFDRFYPNGEPAIGPVATPLPDDTYVAQPSNINPNDAANSAAAGIWVLTRSPENQYVPERWVQIQVPSERFIEVVNQESGPPLATDTIKSVVAPAPPVKSQFIRDSPPSVVQQVWVRAPDIVASQKATTIVADVPTVKQVFEVAPPSVKQIVQQQVTKDTLTIPPPAPLPPTPAIISKTQFTVPPPPPPPLKGGDVSPNIISSLPVNIVSDPNVLTSNKNVVQQIRHIWIPTSSSTGKFISVPVSPAVESVKAVPNKGTPLDVAPISVSDTWVLKQDGPIPSFQQQKSVGSPPFVQGGKVVFQDPPVFQVDTVPAPPVVAQVDSPKNAQVITKSIDTNVPVGLWPPRKDIANSKVLGKSPGALTPELLPPPPPPPKTETVVLGKSFPAPPPIPQKTLVSSPKNGPFPPPLPPATVQIVNGKPCPIPPPLLQKSPFPPSNPRVISVPRFISTSRRQPLTRIVRVNRYPTGSYYLLNTRPRPNIFTYPSAAYVRQSKPRLVRLVQAPIQVQSKPTIPVQTKQISIPFQSKVPVPVPARQVVFPFSGRQLVIPISSAKSPSRIVYPAVQPVRYAYPWNASLKPNPVPGIRVLASPQLSPLKKPASKKKPPKSASSSSESSSDSSYEASKEEKKEDKERLEEKPQNEESSSESNDKETESNKESKSEESKSEESKSESKESIEAAESQLSQRLENLAVIKDGGDSVRVVNKPYIFRFDHRDRNGTIQHQQAVSDTEDRVTGSYGYHDAESIYRLAQYIANSDGFRVNLESNEPETVTHGSAHANFISNQVTATVDKSIYEHGESTDRSITTDSQRD